jgi:hypothetical protein
MPEMRCWNYSSCMKYAVIFPFRSFDMVIGVISFHSLEILPYG